MRFRLNFVVEGQTEERFVNMVLRDHFADQSVDVAAHRVTTRRDRRAHHIIYRGGLTTYKHALSDIRRWMRQDRKRNARFTTMFDLYKLPRDFPRYEDANRESDPYARVRILEEALGEDVADRRFVPYIQLHEFEALLFSDLQELYTQFPESRAEVEQLTTMASALGPPELVDDGPTTAPSKRITAAIPAYARRKASAGPIVAAKIGLPALQSRCQHFREWLERLAAACT